MNHVGNGFNMKKENISWHGIKLEGSKVKLRPVRESDWEFLYKWCNDPEVLYYSEGDDVEGYDLETVKQIYKPESESKFCFMIEFETKPLENAGFSR